MKHLIIICLMVLFSAVAFAPAAMAGYDDEAPAGNASEDLTVFTSTINKLGNLFVELRKIIYVAAAFALIGVAIAGIMGKVKWSTVAHLAAGLFILIIAAEIINYAASGNKADVKIKEVTAPIK